MALVLDVLTAIDERSMAESTRRVEHELEESGRRAGEGFGHNMLEGLTAGFGRGEFESLTGVLGSAGMLGKATQHGEAIGVAFAGGITAAAGVALVKLGLDVGDTFEGINRQITLHTAASGQALDALKSHADALVGSLDSSTKTLGSDMATLATRLQMGPGAALDQLTQHVEMLSDRFGTLNVDALSGAFRQFGVSGEQADSVLASLTQSAQTYSASLPTLVTETAQFATTLGDAHLNMEQSGRLLAELEARGVPAATAMTGIETAMKGAQSQGQDFATFLDRAARSLEYYKETGNDVAAQELSLAVFGTRRWAQAQVAMSDYLDVVRQGPDAYRSNGAALDDLAEKTRTLDNRWQEVRNKVEAALAPVALNVVDDVSGKMDSFVGFLNAHQQDLASFFGTAIGDIGAVVEGAGELAGFLGHFPALIDLGTTALVTFGAVKAFSLVAAGVQTLMAAFDGVTLWFLGAPAEASASAAGVEAAMTEMGATTTAAGAEMATALAPVEAELGAIPAEAAAAGSAITASMTEADAAVLALNASLDGVVATLGAVAAGAAALAAPIAAVAAGVGALYAIATAKGSATGQEDTPDYTKQGQMALGPDGKPLLGPDGKPIIAGAPGAGPAGPSVPFFDAQGRPLNAQGQPFGGPGAPNPTPYTPGDPKTQSLGGIPGAPAVPGVPPGGAPDDLLNSDMLNPHKGHHPKGPRLPEPPQLPYGPGYGAPPRPGETAGQYEAEQKVLEQKHAVAEGQARLNQLEHDNNATADDIQKARNDLLKAQKDENDAELQLYQEQTRQLGEHHRQMGQLGAEIDKDFGISKGLPGIAENITKFVANLTMAGPLAALQRIIDQHPTHGGGGLIGMAAANGAFGPQFTEAGADGGAAGMPQGPFGGFPGARGGGGARFSGVGSSAGSVNSVADLATAGGRVQALYQLANSLQGTPYSTQLRNDCSGMVSELAHVAVGLPVPGAGDRFSTANEGQWLSQHGFQPGLGGPDDLNIGWHQGGPGGGHTAATLPGGVHAEQGGATPGDKFTLGPGAAGAENPEFEFHAHLPMGAGAGAAAPAGFGSPAGAAGAGSGVVSVYVVNMPGGGGGAPFGAGSPGAPGHPGPHPGASPSGFPGAPKGPDTVPIWARPGEKVMNTAAAHQFGPMLDAMNAHPQYLDAGGDVDPSQKSDVGGPAASTGYGSGMPGGGGPAEQGVKDIATQGISAATGFGGGASAPGGGLAAGAGAGMASMGIGIAAQIAMQEIQRGIQYGGQLGGIGMEAIGETLLPAGSKLAQNSWFTRIAGGLSGAMPQIPNMAGKATDPSKAGKQAMTPLADPTQQQSPLMDPTLPAGALGNAPGTAPLTPATAAGPTPASVTKQVQRPPDPLDHHGGDGGQGGHHNTHNSSYTGVHIENYHAYDGEDRAGQDLARWHDPLVGTANGPSRGTSQWA